MFSPAKSMGLDQPACRASDLQTTYQPLGKEGSVRPRFLCAGLQVPLMMKLMPLKMCLQSRYRARTARRQPQEGYKWCNSASVGIYNILLIILFNVRSAQWENQQKSLFLLATTIQYPKMKTLIFLLGWLCLSASALPPQTPVIGILTQTHTDTAASKTSYIAASYVKFIEMSGAQVVPIYSFADTSAVLGQLAKINGVLFPGGGMDFNMSNQWTKNADAILKYAKQQNDAGNPFPVWGTCLGIQLLAYLTSNYNNTIISRVHGDDAIILPLNMVGTDNYLFKTFNSAQLNAVTKGTGVFYFNHNWAVSLDTWNSNPYLKNFWTLTATATTPQNEKFVAGWQAKNYPFFGVQFHPEKNPFEWKVYADRSLEAIEVVQIIANRFVEVARQNKNKFASPEQFTRASIYNFKTQPTTMSFTEIYVFNEVPRLQDA